jgi:tetratricopeptide (TPR) repeat protein
MGIAYRELEEYEKAIESYKKAIEINPKKDDAYNNMGNAYDKAEKYEKAIESYKKAIKLNPKQLYKDNLKYAINNKEIKENHQKLKLEYEQKNKAIIGANIYSRIKDEKLELIFTKIAILVLTIALVLLFPSIIREIYYSLENPYNIHLLLFQATFMSFFISSPLIWILNSLNKRKSILELSIHDLQDKHYLISIYDDLEDKEQYTSKIFNIMSNDSTAKLLSKMYNIKSNDTQLLEVIKILKDTTNSSD